MILCGLVDQPHADLAEVDGEAWTQSHRLLFGVAVAAARRATAEPERALDSLEVLLPDYLPALPRSPWDGSPLEWRAPQAGFTAVTRSGRRAGVVLGVAVP